MKFIYVMRKEDADALRAIGYHEVRSNPEKSIWVFENTHGENFSVDGMDYVLSNMLTF